jgi:PAS domain S-box-containing protein
MTILYKERVLTGTMALSLVTWFILDCLTPLSFASHVLYATAVLMAAASRFPRMPVVAAAIGTGFTILGGFISPATPDLPLWIPVGNRVFTVVILWVLAWFAYKRRQAESAIHKANEGLEQKVAERTEELASVNRALVAEITDRIQTEQALRLSEGRLAGILDIAEDAIIVIEADRSIALFNKGATKLFGYDPDEVLGQSIDLLLPERFRLAHAQHIDAFALAAEPARRMAQRREVFGLKKDGTEFPAEASISKLTVGRRTTFTVILRDITDRLRSERQLQSLTMRLMTAQDEERRRISRELHDDINQRLALLAIDMGRLDANLPASAGPIRATFQSLVQRLAAISDDVRRMAYHYHPSILDDLGLPAALKRLADEFSARTAIKTIVVQQEELAGSLPREIASCLYRIAQESLANVSKHARASRVELELTCDGREVTLSVRDDGVGFDLDRTRAHHQGLGLINIRERARSVEGRLEIESQPGRGTRLVVEIPLPGAHHEETAGTVGR